MDDNCLVSVIIPTYKRDPSILGRALSSALEQTYGSREILVVDDNRDAEYAARTEAFVGGFGNVRYLKNDGIPGACGARNLGAERSRGEVLAFLDDDDAWERQKLAEMTPLLDGTHGLVYCRCSYYRKNRRVKSRMDSTIQDLADRDPVREILAVNRIGGCSVPVLSRDAFVRAGAFDAQMPAGQDKDLWVRMLQTTRAKFLDKRLVRYSITDDSITRDLEKKNEARFLQLKKYADLFEKYPDAKTAVLNRIIVTELIQGETGRARALYREQFGETPESARAFRKLLARAAMKRIVFQMRGYG